VVERRLLVRLTDGTYAPRTLHQLSGGQWRRLSLALSLAFSECSLERTGTTCNLLVLDEVQHVGLVSSSVEV
jgi:DNA repair exonuclease SbcCD ATPase subunit